MLLEALVFTVCVQNSGGCSEGTSAYYEQSLSLKEMNYRIQDLGRQIVNDQEWVVYVGTPVYSVLAKQSAKFLIYRGTTLDINPWKQTVGLQWDY